MKQNPSLFLLGVLLNFGILLLTLPKLPLVIKVSVYIGEQVVLPIVVSLLSAYLYDKLKERKENRLGIKGTQIEINTEKIEILILIKLKEEYEGKKTKTEKQELCRKRRKRR